MKNIETKETKNIEMKTYAIRYRGKRVDTIQAKDFLDAQLVADKAGYNVMSIDIIEIKGTK